MRIERNGEVIDFSGTLEEFLAHPFHLIKGWSVAGPEVEPELVDYTESNYANLWQAAHDYEFQRISGSAIGMLTLGVLQGKPKCTAVAGWLKSLWDDNYYPRKELVTSLELTQEQLDFSVLGEMPYSVPELTAEVYA